MTNNEDKFLYIIPCRGGSKRIKNKNFKLFANKSLLQISIETILDANVEPYNIIVSSDSNKAKIISESYKTIFHKRSKALSSDKSKTLNLIKELIKTKLFRSSHKYIMIIQPTSPLRTSEDIKNSRKKIISENCNSLISITECTFSMPDYLYFIDNNNKLKKYNSNNDLRSQDMQKTFFRNGAIYISSIEFLKSSDFLIDEESMIYHKMPFIRSVNIDTLDDWELAEKLYKI